MRPLENLLSRLEGVRRGRENHAARCPAHEDRHASLSIREATDGKVLLNCHAGCDVGSIVGAVGLTISDLFPDSTSNGTSSGPFTLEELSRQRCLPVDLLRSLGLTSSGTYVRVPYRQADGTEARPQLRARDGQQRWGMRGNEPELDIIPYGLDRLDSGECALVEGCSDAWTLWNAGFPALGIPGANMGGTLKAGHIRSLSRIDIVKEADDGGKTFERNVRARLRKLQFAGEIRVVDMAGLGAKDPSALFMQDPDGFADTWRQALEDATDSVQDDEPPVATSLPWQPFPVDTLPPAAADYIRAAAAAIGCDEATVAVPVLGVLATAVGNSHPIALKRNWTEHSALWLAVVARSGEHKSPALYAALKPVYDREKKAAAEYEIACEQYERDLAEYNALDKTVKGMTEKPIPPIATRYRTGDATVESLAYLHNENPRGLAVVRDELAGLFGAFDKYSGGSSDMQSWIEIADGRPVVIDRKTGDRKTLRIESPCVPIIGGTQPGILRDKLKPPFFDSGFAARFLFVAPPAHVPIFTDADVEVGVWQRYDYLVGGLYERPSDGEPIPLSEEARRLFKWFYDASHAANAKVSSDRLRAAFVKHVGFCARFALIFHLADTPSRQEAQPVTADAMQRAVRLALWFRHETARLYHKFGFIKPEGVGRDEELARQLPGSFTRQDVSDVWGVEKSQAYEVVKRLIRDGLAKGAGRGSYLNRTSDLPDLPDFGGVEVEIEGVSPVIPAIPVSDLPQSGDGASSPAYLNDGPDPWENEDPLLGAGL